jgi:probable HAF family extracellular repeat protein
MLAAHLVVLCSAQVHVQDSLADLGSGPYAAAFGINGVGDVVGTAQGQSRNTLPVLWSQGDIVRLPLLPGDTSGTAYGINSTGAICGQSVGGTLIRAVLWSGGGIQDLGNLGGGASGGIASATCINDAGVVAGNSYPPGGGLTHAFHWSPVTGSISDLGTLGGDYSAATCLDAAGNVYGVATDVTSAQSAVQWPTGGGPAVMLDSVGLFGLSSIARGCSASGMVVGDGFDFALGTRGFVWTAATGLQLLPHPPGTLLALARDVNDAGQVIVFGYDQRIWLHDLNTGGWLDLGASLPPFPHASLTTVGEINNAGQISGYGVHFATGSSLSAWRISPAPDGLGLGEPFPARAGALNALGAKGSAPFGTLLVVAGLAAGVASVPGCAGLTVGIHAPALLATATADAQGIVQLTNLLAPASLAGREVLLQAVELASCRASNLSAVTFR